MRRSDSSARDTLRFYQVDWQPGMGDNLGEFVRNGFIQMLEGSPFTNTLGASPPSPIYFGPTGGSSGGLSASFTGPSIFNNSYNNPVDITMNPQFITNQSTFINIDAGGGTGNQPGVTGPTGPTGGTGPAGTSTIKIAPGVSTVSDPGVVDEETGFLIGGLVGGVAFTGSSLTFVRKDLFLGFRMDVSGNVITLTMKGELRDNTEDILVIPIETCSTVSASTALLITATTEDAILVGPNGTLAGPDGILLTDKDNSTLLGTEYDVCLMSEDGFILTDDNGMILFNTTSATDDSIDRLLVGGDGDLLWDDDRVVLYGD